MASNLKKKKKVKTLQCFHLYFLYPTNKCTVLKQCASKKRKKNYPINHFLFIKFYASCLHVTIFLKVS